MILVRVISQKGSPVYKSNTVYENIKSYYKESWPSLFKSYIPNITKFQYH